MSATEILPVLQSLPRADKFRIVQALLEQLAVDEEASFLREGHVYPIHTPEYSPGAASQLAQVFADAEKEL